MVPRPCAWQVPATDIDKSMSGPFPWKISMPRILCCGYIFEIIITQPGSNRTLLTMGLDLIGAAIPILDEIDGSGPIVEISELCITAERVFERRNVIGVCEKSTEDFSLGLAGMYFGNGLFDGVVLDAACTPSKKLAEAGYLPDGSNLFLAATFRLRLA